jgi:hypothetical protein
MTTQNGKAKTSLLFREVNMRINEVSQAWSDGEDRDFLCECGDGACTEAIAVARADYGDARTAGFFLFATAHGDESEVAVIKARGGYSIVDVPNST